MKSWGTVSTLTVVCMALLGPVACSSDDDGEGKVKGGGLCEEEDDCVDGSCGSTGICAAGCERNDDCAPEAWCDTEYGYCVRPCSAGCGDRSSCYERLGECNL